MVGSMTPSTVAEYLASLPADHRDALSAVRKEINRCLPSGYEEGIQFGMISWYVPLAAYPKGYGGNPKVPLAYVGLGSKKGYMALYVCDGEVVDAHRPRLGKLNCGKGCIRFRNLDELPLEVVSTILKEAWQRRKGP